jgi:O-antigen/teichoic acid export membrane protein
MSAEESDRAQCDFAELVRTNRLGMKRRLLWSLSAQVIALTLRAVLQIVMVPVLLFAWGASLYADWIVISSATAFLSVIELGMQTYFGNLFLMAWSRGDQAGYRRHYATGMCLYAGLLVLAMIILLAVTSVVSWPSVFGIHAMSSDAALLTCAIMAVASLSLIPTGILTARYRTRNFGLSISASVIAEAARGFGVCLVALSGGTTVDAALVFLVVAGLIWLVVGIDQRWRYGDMALAFAIPTAHELREVISQSTRYAMPMIAVPVIYNGPIILLGALASSPEAVVSFSVFRTLTGIVRQIVYQFCFALGGEMGRFHSLADADGLRRLFIGAARLVPGLAGLLGGFLLVTAPSILHVWTHDRVAFDETLVTVFTLIIILTAPAQIAYMAFHYTNRPNALFAATGGQVVGTIVFCALLIGKFSAVGAALGTGLAECMSVGILLPYVACREISLPLLSYLGRCARFAALGLVIGYGAAACLQHIFVPRRPSEVMAAAALWGVIVAVPALITLLDKDLRAWLLSQAIIAFSRTAKKGSRHAPTRF